MIDIDEHVDVYVYISDDATLSCFPYIPERSNIMLVYPPFIILYRLLWNLGNKIQNAVHNKSTTPHDINHPC